VKQWGGVSSLGNPAHCFTWLALPSSCFMPHV
jgi:hypothetical protein